MSAHGTHPATRRPGRLARAAVLVIPPLFVFTGWLVHRRWEYQRAVEAIFGDAALGPYRRTAARLTYPPAARHRPFSAPCQKDDCAPTLRHADLARLERAGDIQGLAAAYALSGDHDRALKLLDTLPSTADIESDRAALLSHTPRRAAEALTAADRALRIAPRHPGALWNRAIVMETLALPLAAARSFRAVEKLGEAGWTAEARQRAERLEGQWHGRVAAFKRARQDAERVKIGLLPAIDTIRGHPDLVRRAFAVAIRDHKTAALTPALRFIAEVLDQASGTSTLVRLVDRQDLLRKLPTLINSRRIDDAHAYQRLVETTRDPWFAVRAHQLLGRALIAAGRSAEAEDAFRRSLAACGGWRFPDVCLESKVWLAYDLISQHDLQRARRLVLEVAAQSVQSTLPMMEADAHALLAALEDARERFPMARAFAEQAALQTEHCEAANTGREQLAKLALAEGDASAARVHLNATRSCPGRAARFQMIGTEALAGLARHPAATSGQERRWLHDAIRAHRAIPGLPRRQDLGLRLASARDTLSRDRQRARAELAGLAAGHRDEDGTVRMIALQASSALVVDSVEHGELAPALAALEQMQGVTAGRRCVLGAARSDGRWAYVVNDRSGSLHGVTSPAAAPAEAEPAPAIPASLLGALGDCAEVGVIATAPVLGQSRLLPDHFAWGYLQTNLPRRTFDPSSRRLVIWDVQPPPELGLQRLLAVPDIAPPGDHRGGAEQLRGPAATPTTVRARMPAADLIELHVHGVVDPEVSDAAALALSPDPDGRSLLTGHDLLTTTLPLRPGVILAACRAGLSARYGAFQWSLPVAFLRAGARWVVASPTPVEDAEGPAFFSAVWRRIVAGAPPAVALRDERTAGRWRRSHRQWTSHVVLFH